MQKRARNGLTAPNLSVNCANLRLKCLKTHITFMRGVRKLKVEEGHSRGVCDFCLEKGEVFRLKSAYRYYRFLNVCQKCLTKIRSGFRQKE